MSDHTPAPSITNQPAPPAAGAAPALPVFRAPAPPPSSGSFRRGFGLGAGAGLGAGGVLVLLGILGSILAVVVTAGIQSAFVRGTGVTPTSLRTVWGKDSASAANTIRAIPISGPIMAAGGDGLVLGAATYGYEIAATLDALQPDDAAGVALLINTPGGTINGSRAIADAVERYQARTGKKVAAYVRGMSASGGMYSMAGADKIIADHGSLVGSIGVIFGPFTRYKDVVATGGSFTEPGVSTRGGITQEYLTQGEGKDFGNPYRDMTEKERKTLTDGMANEYQTFVEWVSKNRNIPVNTIKNDLGAYIYDPKTAQAKGLIDAEMGLDEAFRDMATLAGVDPNQARFAQTRGPGFIEQLLGAEAREFGYAKEFPPGTQVKVTGVLCTGAPQTLMFHGPTLGICG